MSDTHKNGNGSHQNSASQLQEMNMFASMANADIENDDSMELAGSITHSHSSHDNGAKDENDDENDDKDLVSIRKLSEERRLNEMNAFSAMAGGGWNAGNDSDHDSLVGAGDDDANNGDDGNDGDSLSPRDADDMDDEDDELLESIRQREKERRHNEMSAFAAMANADLDRVDNHADDGNGDEKDELNSKNPNNIDDDDDDELITALQKQEDQRRQSEMSAFAAMANADMEWVPPSTSPNANDSSVPVKNKDSKKKNAWKIGKKNHHHNKADNIAGGVGGSLIVDKANIPKAENKNLDAALAMFESEIETEDDTNNNKAKSTAERPPLPLYPTFQATHKQRKPVFDQIYTEKVMIQRPLFFGTVIPERVQKMIRTGEEDMFPEGPNGPYRPEVHQHLLSPASQSEDSSLCRNLEGAVEAFGQISLGSSRRFDFKTLEKNSHVSLFEPVWGDEARLKREDRIMEHLSRNNVDNSEVSDDVDSYIVVDVGGGDAVNNYQEDGNGSIVMSEARSMGPRSPPSNNGESPPKGFIGDAKNFVVSPQHESGGDFSDPSSDLSENLFLQYARGNSHGMGGTFVGATGTLVSVPETSALQNIPDAKGSFEASELKKHIGLNDNLTKALEALVGKEGNAAGASSASFALESTEAVGSETIPTVKDGRPLSNLEITMGKVPLYGCDDAPLPSLVDLFVPETKGDQIRSYEQYESEEIISSRALPNIFGPLVCPSRCSGPNDSQSWYSRRNDIDFATNIHQDVKPRTHRSHKSLDSFSKIRPSSKSSIPSPLPTPPMKGSTGGRTLDSRRDQDSVPSDISPSSGIARHHSFNSALVGWWNIDENISPKDSRPSNATLQASPKRNRLRPNDYGGLVSPSQDDLLRENRSMAELHPAVSTVAQLPLLSDRSPGTRYIQIDTQVVGFPSLGEIEPFFCSMAIWYVEPVSERLERGLPGDEPLRGRITESLCFDVASEHDPEIALSPLLDPSLLSKEDTPAVNKSLQPTRCGVFPIKSCYEMKYLHAVLVVHKVLADDSESDIYWSNDSDTNKSIDVTKYRNRAKKAVERVGHMLTPFAFGVAPLAQIMGTESPTIPTSKAAQIPLFKLNSGEGDDPIINHIIAITQPR